MNWCFLSSYLTAQYHEDFPSVHNLLLEGINTVLLNYKSDAFRAKIENVKLDLIEIHKRYFLSFIATEIRTSLECDM